MTEPLSPAAQAVINAAVEGGGGYGRATAVLHARIAAALRAAADQVVPEPPMIVEGGRTYEEAWTATVHDDIRRRFLAIVAELEADHA
jgi:ABC-type phosphate/phosphonate transport system substrate-binding protein